MVPLLCEDRRYQYSDCIIPDTKSKLRTKQSGFATLLKLHFSMGNFASYFNNALSQERLCEGLLPRGGVLS